MNKFTYYLVLGGFKFVSFLPLKVLYLLADFINLLIYHVFGYRKKVVVENLRNSFPEKSEDEIQDITKKYYRHLSNIIIENVYLRFASNKKVEKMFEVENVELFKEFRKQDKSIIFMQGHYGNWEFAGGVLPQINYKSAAVYKKLSSKIFDQIYIDIRSRYGCQPVEMHDVLRKILTFKKEKDPFAIMMVADQSPMKRDQKHWLTFLNQPTGAYLGTEKLACKFDMPVVFVELRPIKKGLYRMIPTLISDSPQKTKPNEITEKYFEILESTIKRAPEYWLWSHRRWKHKPEPHELNAINY